VIPALKIFEDLLIFSLTFSKVYSILVPKL